MNDVNQDAILGTIIMCYDDKEVCPKTQRARAEEFSLSFPLALADNQGRLAPGLSHTSPTEQVGVQAGAVLIDMLLLHWNQGRIFNHSVTHRCERLFPSHPLLAPSAVLAAACVGRSAHFPISRFLHPFSPSLANSSPHPPSGASLSLSPFPHPLHLASLHRNSLPFMVFLDKDIL